MRSAAAASRPKTNTMETQSTPIRRTSKSDIQSSFLTSIRSRLPKHVSLPDEMAELLSISRDSAYRRIREETILSLDEVKVLCERYNVSIDQLMGRDSGRVSFEFKAQFGPGISLKSWLESIHSHLKALAAKPDAQITWHSKDLPIFHYFHFPRLAAFKFYWWMNLANDDFSDRKYDERLIGAELTSLGERIWNQYARIPSTEIVSRELINTTLRQIEYAHDGGLLSPTQAIELCNECSEMVNHLEQQTHLGLKGQDNEPGCGRFEVYLNELMTGDNTLLLQAGDERTVYVTCTNFNILSTNHASFCRQTGHFMQAMVRKGMLISKVAERERIKFFNRIRREVEQTLASLRGDQ